MRAGHRLETLPVRPRALFVGTDQLQDESGLLSGLATVADVMPFTKRDGSYGQLDAHGRLSFALTRDNGTRLLELLADAEARARPFHLIVGQMWSGYTDPSVLEFAKRRFGIVVVNLAMDDRHAFEARKAGRSLGTRRLASAIDLAATAAPEAVDWYRAEGCAAIFFPEASDSELFRPRPEIGKAYDVSFVGACYGIRKRLVTRLCRDGIQVHARGEGWPEGRVPVRDVPDLFARSRIVLGTGAVGQSERLVALKLRDFDGPMSGSCYVTQRNADLDPLFRVGEEVVVYEDVEDCVGVISGLLADAARRERIAYAGRARAEGEHTWGHRFRHLMVVLHDADQLDLLAPSVSA